VIKKFVYLVLFFNVACKEHVNTSFDRFPEGKTKEKQLAEGIAIADPDLELSLFGAEPDFANPTNMDIDHRGRVWLCEAYNYRNDVNNIPYRKLGDRILILEDTNSDGKADKTKVFYQGEDVNSALGIVVLGNKVIVSCAPNVWVFTDTNDDDVPDKKEVLFKTVGGFQSDHGLHSFVFGPDDWLYFNMGNFGIGLLDKNNKPIKDIYGQVIDGSKKPFQDGMAIRCDLAGTKFEVLGANFRNNYELAVDAFGRVWQSDNDDDGVRGNRINYVMPHGNYGYKDEMTGADWRVERTNMEDSVFLQHWHQNDPGVVPNLHQTYAGSPTGILVYEGDVFPKKYQNSIFLADAGTNELNKYEIKQKGAGYGLLAENVLDGAQKDKWFRPSDICVAPDGSIFVADWYDSGVGGHFVGDLDRGRVYRLAPKGATRKIRNYNFSNPEEATLALQNPNGATRFLAFKALEKMGKKAQFPLEKMWNSPNLTYKARALWLLAKLDSKYVLEATQSQYETIRATAVRVANQDERLGNSFFAKMAADVSPMVKEAVAVSLYKKHNPAAWLTLAKAYTPGDRWLLEALGIAAEGQWDIYLKGYLDEIGPNWLGSAAAKELVWRSRASFSPQLLAQVIASVSYKASLPFFRAFDFQNAKSKNKALLQMLEEKLQDETKLLIFKHFDAASIQNDPAFVKILPKVLAQIKNDNDFLEIVAKYEIKSQKSRLLRVLSGSSDVQLQTKAAAILSQLFGAQPIRDVLQAKPVNLGLAVDRIKKMGLVDNEVIARQLILIFSDKRYHFKIREAAMLAMEGYHSDVKLWNLMKVNMVSAELIPAAKVALSKTLHTDLKLEFEYRYGTPSPKATVVGEKFLNRTGDVVKGKAVFGMYCTACHVAENQGQDFGPNLSLIGKKLTKASIYNAIVNPSQGINFGYEGHLFTLKDGSTFQAIITSQTSDAYLLKFPGQTGVTVYKKAEVKEVSEMKTSMMPTFSLKEDEYADLLTYLSGLKK
jgi:putative membrane-bound dehydrogenase-like protein